MQEEHGDDFMGLMDKIKDVMLGKPTSTEQSTNQSAEQAIEAEESTKAKPTMPTPHQMRVATVRSVAERAEMRVDAMKTPDEELFEKLSWVRDDTISVLADKFQKAAAKGETSVFLGISCFDDFYDDREMSHKIKGGAFGSFAIGRRIENLDGSKRYEFEDEISMWRFFYQYAAWIDSMLQEQGYNIKGSFSLNGIGGWDEAKTKRDFTVSWGNEDFDANIGNVYERSQADAYEKGVPLADLFLGDASKIEIDAIKESGIAGSEVEDPYAYLPSLATQGNGQYVTATLGMPGAGSVTMPLHK